MIDALVHRRSDSTLPDVGAVAVTTALLVVSGLGGAGPVRLLLALAFATFVPGWALLGYVNLAGRGSRAALAVALSLTACTVGALAMAWLGQWHPRFLLDVLAAFSLLAILAHLAGEPAGEAP